MGLSYCEKYLYDGWYTNSEHNYRICDFDGLKYDSSWNELMPVVKKIKNFKVPQRAMKEHEDRKYVHKDDAKYQNNVIDSLKEVDIKLSYNKVVEFIGWYNENKKEKL